MQRAAEAAEGRGNIEQTTLIHVGIGNMKACRKQTTLTTYI